MKKDRRNKKKPKKGTINDDFQVAIISLLRVHVYTICTLPYIFHSFIQKTCPSSILCENTRKKLESTDMDFTQSKGLMQERV